jgi:ribosomal protein S8
MARLEAGAESLKSHSSLTVYNTQGKTTTSYTYTISKSDRKILKSFAKEHFTEEMSVSEKVATTMEWIHTNVTYASSSSLWSKISGKSWVEAIFKYQAGQCAQYNGALACMMAYLGYDIAMVQGYRTSSRGSYWQHFWARVTIDNVNYIVEAGNAGKSGNWYYLCAKYSETKGYVL